MNSKYFVLGGDIKKSLTEGYRFDLKTLFKTAYNVTYKHFFPLVTACLIIILALFALATLFITESGSVEDPIVVVLFFLISLLIAPPIVTGMLMMGINHSIGLKSKTTDLFNYFNIILKLSLAAMMISLMANAASMLLSQLFGSMGFMLSIIILLYLKMSFCLVYPLIAEKKVPPTLALKLSFKLVNKNLGQFTQLLIIFSLLFIVGVITSGIGLLFIIPFYINVMGIIYRQICGVSITVTGLSENDDDDHNSGEQVTERDTESNTSTTNNGTFEA